MTTPSWDDAAFRDGWTMVSIEAEAFDLNSAGTFPAAAQAWLATITRLAPDGRISG